MALEISIKKLQETGLCKEYFSLRILFLYTDVRARLYIGFSIRVNLKEKNEPLIEFNPQAYVRVFLTMLIYEEKEARQLMLLLEI